MASNEPKPRKVWRLSPSMLYKYEISNDGEVRHARTKKLRHPLTYYGYYSISFYDKGKFFMRRVHRLVAEAFIPNPGNKLEVNHINGVKTDNKVENLEWSTRSENQQHAYNTGLQIIKSGENSHMSILTARQVSEIKSKYIPRKYSQYKIAQEYGVSRSCIMHIISGDRWKSL